MRRHGLSRHGLCRHGPSRRAWGVMTRGVVPCLIVREVAAAFVAIDAVWATGIGRLLVAPALLARAVIVRTLIVGTHLDLGGDDSGAPGVQVSVEHRLHEARCGLHLVHRNLDACRRSLRRDAEHRRDHARSIERQVPKPSVLLAPHAVLVDRVLDRGQVRHGNRLDAAQGVAPALRRLHHGHQLVARQGGQITLAQRSHDRGGGRLQGRECCIEVHAQNLSATTDRHP